LNTQHPEVNNFIPIPPPIQPFYKRIRKEQLHPNYLIRNIIRPINNLFKGGERKTSYGQEDTENTYYIIGFPRGEDGLLFLMLCNLSHIGYALEHGYIPVVDQQNYDNQYLKAGTLFKENSWEYYFKQPLGYTLEDIKNSKNIILSKKLQMPVKKYTIDFYIFEDKRRLTYFRELFNKYIIFNDKTMDHLLNSYNEIFSGKTDVLGILCRGTDYLIKKPGGHPIQPDPYEVIKKAKEIIEKFNCKYIYLATEDQDIYEIFESEFKEKIFSNNKRRIKQNDFKEHDYISQILNSENQDNYRLGLEYLSSLYNLSKCKYFIGGKTAGTIGVYFMSSGFAYDYIWDLGFYPLPPLHKTITRKFRKFLLNKNTL
jgi:hypothetical protein